MNLFSLAKEFPTEDLALDYWVKTRWPDGVNCLKCGHGKVYRIDTVGKTKRPCRVYECAKCKEHFSATTGTLFHDSHLPMQKWFAAIALMCEAKKGISANQMKRHLGISYKTAWYLCHRIRAAMSEDNSFMVGGPSAVVEVDEMYLGGKLRNAGYKANHEHKSVVLGLAERQGKIHMQSLPNAKRESIAPVMSEKLDNTTPQVITDAKQLYRSLIPRKQHDERRHKWELRISNHTSTYTVEGAFSLFKRGVIGSYHQLSREHLDRYLGEFCWRYNRRKYQPEMFQSVIRNLGARQPLPYDVLVDRKPF